MMPLISVVTPVHISTQDQMVYLRDLIHSFSKQTYKNKELIISDDLSDPRVKELCNKMNTPVLKVKYIPSPEKGISKNLNFVISKAHGKLIKILFQDDFFTCRYALLLTWVRLSLSKKCWHVSASIHFQQSTNQFINKFKPRVSNALLDGKNYISSPSVVTFKTIALMDFCPNLDYLMDCEWYLRMSHNYGLPIFGKYTFIANRLHSDQATNWAKEKLQSESSFSKEIHDETRMDSRKCKCTS